MLHSARREAHDLECDVDLNVGDANALAFPNERYDTVVVILDWCYLSMYEAGPPHSNRAACLRTALRDHFLLEPLDHLKSERSELERVERSRWGIVERVLARRSASMIAARPVIANSRTSPQDP